MSFTGASGLTVTGSSATFANDFDFGSVSGQVKLGTPTNSLTTIDGVIRGGAADTVLFFEGGGSGQNNGALRLNGINTLTGTIQIQQGPLILGNASAAGAARIVLNSNLPAAGALQFADSFTIANGVITNTQIDKIGVSTGLTGGISGVISGAAGIEKVGAGRLVLSGTNTYAGTTVISSGTLQVGDGGAAGTLGGGAVSNGGALVFNRSDALTVSSAISGTGSLVQAGPGATVLTGGNTYTGATTISSGTLQVGSGGSGSTLGGAGTITNDGALIFNIGDSQTLSRSVTGTGNLTKSGAGALTLAGNNFYAGGTTISGGTLTVAGTSSIGPGQVRFTAPSTLTVTSTAVTFPNAFDLGSVSGTVTLMVSTTSSTVINGPITGGGPNTTLFFDNPIGGANTGILTLNGTNSFQGSLMVYRGPLILGNASAAGASTLKLFANNNPAGDLQFGAGGFTIPNDVQLQLGGVNNWIGVPSGQTNGISGVISGNGFTKIGAGTLVLAADNSYSGGTAFTSGTVQVGNGGAAGSLGSGAVANGGALVFNRTGSLTVAGAISGTGSLTQAGSGATVLTGGNTYSGATTISSGTLQVGSGGSGSTLGGSGTIANDGSLVFNIGDSQTLSRSVVGAGNLTKFGAGALTLAGNNSYSGGTTISGGTLTVAGTSSIGPGQVRFTAPSTLTVTSTTVTFPNAFDLGSVSGTVTLMVSTTSSTVINGPITGGNANTTLFFDNPIGGANTGILTLNGTNSFQGSLMVYRGPLILGNASAAGASTLKLFANNNPAGDLQFGAGGFTIANNVELVNGGVANWIGVPSGQTNGISGVISGNGFTKIGAGTLVLEADNSYSGGTTFTSGTVQVGNGGAAGSLGSGPVSNGGAIVFNRSGSLTVSSAISGTGSVTTAGPGTIVLSGSNSFTGGTVLSAGVLALGSANAIGSTGTISFGGGTLQYTASNTSDYSGRFSTAAGQQYAIDTNGQAVSIATALTSSGGSLTKSGLGTLTLTGSSSYSGSTLISAGTLQVGNGGTTGALGSGSVVNDAALVFNRSNDLTVANAISGAGSVTKQAAGVLTLSGSNAYSGGTTLTAGSLRLQHASALGTGSLTQASGGSTLAVDVAGTIANDMSLYNVRFDKSATLAGGLTLNGATLDVTTGVSATASGLVSGAGGITKTGAGAITLSGSNAFAGDTALTGGTLVLAHANALGASRVLAMQPGTTLTLNQRTYVGDLDQFGGTINGTGELVTTLFRTSSGTIAAPIADADGGIARGIRKISSGMTTVTTANTFTGATRVEAGTLALGSGGSFAAGSSAELFAGGTLDLAGLSQTFAGVSGTAGTIALGAGTLTVNASATNTFGGGITGSGGLTKQGVGNLVLSGSSTYAGATSVAAGRLSVNGVLGTSPIAVLAAAELGGSGSIAGPVSVANGGTLSPGNSIASLATGTATFAAGATFAYEVDSTDLNALGNAADLLVVNGDLTIQSGALLSFLDLNLSPQPFVEDTTIFALINYSGIWNGGLFIYNGTPLADGSMFMVGTQEWEIDYNRTSATGLANFTGDYLPNSSFVAITAVPEPSTLVLAALGTTLVALAIRRHRRG